MAADCEGEGRAIIAVVVVVLEVSDGGEWVRIVGIVVDHNYHHDDDDDADDCYRSDASFITSYYQLISGDS